MRDMRDGKFKCKSNRELKRQQKYDGYERRCQSKASEKFKSKPYQLEYAETMKGEKKNEKI